MKRFSALLLALVMALSLTACGGASNTDSQPAGDVVYPSYFDGMEGLIAAAQAEGELVVYGSCEEAYLAAACQHFQELFGIRVTSQSRSADALTTAAAQKGQSADVWFGGSAEWYSLAAEAGLLTPYEAINAAHLTDNAFRSPEGHWYGISRTALCFLTDADTLKRMEIDAPADWEDLPSLPYKGLIWLSGYMHDGAGQLLLRTSPQLLDGGVSFLAALDQNVALYATSDADVIKCSGTGECVIGIGYLHDGLARIVDDGCDNVQLVLPASGTALEVEASAILRSAAHPNAARLWMEYVLSPECAELAAENGVYRLPVLDNAALLDGADALAAKLDALACYTPANTQDDVPALLEELTSALTATGVDAGSIRFAE